jgi:ferredoxin, 2Fe-2S
MPKIVFVEFNGTEHSVEAVPGDSVMQAAIAHSVPGILADCGGNCACATCHVYIGDPFKSKLQPPSKEEGEMIECALHVTEQSRLSCQIPIALDMEGMVVRLPESQT